MQAMNKELKSIEVNKTWSLVEFPHGKKEMDGKWVYKVNLDIKGEVTRYKAILVTT